jgi:hypothetical protein
MAFSSTITGYDISGDLIRTYGTYNSAGVATGDIVTGLCLVKFLAIQPNGAAVSATIPSLDETMTSLLCLSVDPTIDCATGETGYWEAWGYI